MACTHVCVFGSKPQLDQISLASPKNYKIQHFCLPPNPSPKRPPAASTYSSANQLFQRPTVQIYLPPVSFPSHISATLPNITSSELQFGGLTDSSRQARLQTDICLLPPPMYLKSSPAFCHLWSHYKLFFFFFASDLLQYLSAAG